MLSLIINCKLINQLKGITVFPVGIKYEKPFHQLKMESKLLKRNKQTEVQNTSSMWPKKEFLNMHIFQIMKPNSRHGFSYICWVRHT